MSSEDGKIIQIINLTNCSEEQAKRALELTGDIVDAVDSILQIPISLGAPKKTVLNEQQEFFTKLRETNEKILNSIEEGIKKQKEANSDAITLSNQPVSEESNETRVPHEGMVLRNSCSQECLIPSLE